LFFASPSFDTNNWDGHPPSSSFTSYPLEYLSFSGGGPNVLCLIGFCKIWDGSGIDIAVKLP